MSSCPKEHIEQVTFLNWFAENYPGVKIMSIPNGGYRHPNEAKKLKLEGVLKGAPDLFVPSWNLWIEMKRIKNGRISEEQEKFKTYVETICEHGHIYGFGWEDAAEKVKFFYDNQSKR